MDRREFCLSGLKLGLLSFGSSALSWGLPSKLWAQSSTPQFFVQIDFQGGWDTSLAMDPWTETTRLDEKDFFVEYRQDELLPMGAHFAGPAMAPLKNYFHRLAVVNGIFMARNDTGHDSASLYAKSGNGQGHLGVLGSELETRVTDSPFGILAETSIYTAQARRMIWDLKGLIANGKIKDSGLLLDLPDKNSELSKARSAILQNLAKVKAFNQEVAKGPSPLTKGRAIAAAFSSGLSGSATFTVSKFFDTHSDHPTTHMKDLLEAFIEVRDVLDTLATTPGIGIQGSLLDQTTVMMVSEFTRTPALNASKGKDHNAQCNSAILMGPGIKPGVIGGSKVVTRAETQIANPYLVGLPLDKVTYQTVTHRDDAFILRPECVAATVAKSMGCNPATISEGLGQAPVLTPILV